MTLTTRAVMAVALLTALSLGAPRVMAQTVAACPVSEIQSDLSVGSEGPAVRSLQTLLNSRGESLPVSGYFGPLTRAAVMSFQRAQGMAYVTGYVGPLTRAKLREVFPCPITGTPELVFPLCAQPPMPVCPAGYVCSMVMPAPRTYTTLSDYTNDKATFLYSGPCSAIGGTTPNPLTITTTTLPAGSVGAAYTAAIETSGGTQDFGWSVVAGNLPPGVRFAQIQCVTTPCPTWSATGQLVGTPSMAGQYTFTVRFSANGQIITKRLSIAVAPESETVPEKVMGVLDYNDDHVVDQSDVQYVLDVAVAARTCPQGRTCDINGDGKTLASDALVLAKYVGTASAPGTLDYNNDLALTTADATTLLSVSVGTIACPASKVCDLDGKDGVTATDARMLLVYVGQ